MRKTGGFTLIELLIVVSIMLIMSGVLSRLWFNMESMAKVSKQKATFMMQAQSVVERIRQDVRNAYELTLSETGVVQLRQLNASGEIRQVVYRMEEQELLRQAQTDEGDEYTEKVADLRQEWFNLTQPQPGVLKIEIQRPQDDQPMKVRGQRLVTFTRIGGGES